MLGPLIWHKKRERAGTAGLARTSRLVTRTTDAQQATSDRDLHHICLWQVDKEAYIGQTTRQRAAKFYKERLKKVVELLCKLIQARQSGTHYLGKHID